MERQKGGCVSEPQDPKDGIKPGRERIRIACSRFQWRSLVSFVRLPSSNWRRKSLVALGFLGAIDMIVLIETISDRDYKTILCWKSGVSWRLKKACSIKQSIMVLRPVACPFGDSHSLIFQTEKIKCLEC